MQNEHDNLDKMDRWHSVLLDVHKWSDHPEIKALSERLYVDTDIDKLDKSGNRKPKRTAKDMLRILLLDLYVNWLIDPSLSIGISRDTASFKVKNNRYNQLHISPVILDVQSRLLEAGYLETIPFYRDRSGRNQSYTTRIRHSSKLRAEFNQLLVDLHDIDFHVSKELILLREKYEDEEGKKQSQLLNYTDTDYTNRIREQLRHITTYCDGLSSTSQVLLNHLFVSPLIEVFLRARRQWSPLVQITSMFTGSLTGPKKTIGLREAGSMEDGGYRYPETCGKASTSTTSQPSR
jgi:hypothetical protein